MGAQKAMIDIWEYTGTSPFWFRLTDEWTSRLKSHMVLSSDAHCFAYVLRVDIKL